MRTFLPVVLAAVFLVSPATASAGTPDGLLQAASAAASTYWTSLGYPAQTPALEMYDETISPGLVVARAPQPGNEISIDRAWWAGQREEMALVDESGLRWLLRQICAVMVHEHGHNLGLGHTLTGVMQPDVGRVGAIPVCAAWAKRVARAAHSHRPRSRSTDAERRQNHS